MCYVQGGRWVPCDMENCPMKNPSNREAVQPIVEAALKITTGEIKPIGKITSDETEKIVSGINHRQS